MTAMTDNLRWLIECWRTGKDCLPSYCGFPLVLRMHKGMVESSRHVCFPVEAFHALWRYVQAGSVGDAPALGGFAVSCITADGDVVLHEPAYPCHGPWSIARAELEYIATKEKIK